MPTPLCILVLEDEFLVRAVIVDHLRDHGCLVVEVQSGEEAIAFLIANNPPIDVLFTDIQLNGSELSGWDVADAFRKSQPRISVIYASGHPPRAERKVDGSLFFSKPYRPDEILKACKRLAA